MENKLLEQVIQSLKKDGTASDKYFLSGIEPDEIKTIGKIAEAYHAAKLAEGKTKLLQFMQLAVLIQAMDKHMANQFQAHDHRQMWEIWRGVADKVEQIEQQLKSKP